MSETYPWLASYPPNIHWDAPLKAEPLYALLDTAAERWPDHHAAHFLGLRMTYAQLAEKVNRAAAGLRALGVKRGVKVGICLPNCPQFIISYYAILKAGGTVVNYSALYTAKEIAHQINDSGTEIMVTMSLEAIYPKVAENLNATCLKKIIVTSLSEALPPLKAMLFPYVKRKEIADFPEDERHILWQQLLNHPPLAEAALVHPNEDIAVLQYTGGTTGTPKGVVLTHANVYINALQCRMWFADAELGRERIMGVLPLFHVFAMTTVMNFGILIGADLILHPRVELRSILKDIVSLKPTLMPGVATLFNAVNNYKDLKKYRLDSLKYCISGGGPLPIEVKTRFEELTGCVLVEGYGLSESSPVTHCNPLAGENKTGSIGLPLPGTVAEIIDREDGTTPLPVGEIGEICIRGPQVMQGYWQKLDETNDTLRDSRLHTGDLGRMDEDGYFYVVDRMKEMIISGGYNIYPRLVEEAIYRHPAVTECAVIGVPHEKWGETPRAFVVVKEGMALDKEMLKEFLDKELAAYAHPRLFDFRREPLPKTMIGKVDKKVLKTL